MKTLALIFTICLTFGLAPTSTAQERKNWGRCGKQAFGLAPTSIAQERIDPKPAEKKAYPAHWGNPPSIQTRDYRQLPGGYGMGSGTLLRWITENMEADKKNPDRATQVAAASEIQLLEKEITDMKDFMTRARFTPEGLVKYKAKLKMKEDQLALLKKAVATSKKKVVPTFDEWLKAGKKIPKDKVFLGGSPWFDESTGKNRSAEAVYKMLFGKDAG